jgi:hypothetical protein
MEKIPQHLREKICMDAICLNKVQLGWDRIHLNIKNHTLYVKKTVNKYISNDIIFESIIRLNRTMYVMGKKHFTWFRCMRTNPMLYYYYPTHFHGINDIFSTNSFGYFLDDEYMDSDNENNNNQYYEGMEVIYELENSDSENEREEWV